MSQSMKTSAIKLGFVLRITDLMAPPGTTTVDEHNRIFESNGEVWLGKFGRAISANCLSEASASSENYLILVSLIGWQGSRHSPNRLLAYISRISKISLEPPPPNLVPSYYRAEKNIHTWFCLAEPLEYIDEKEQMSWTVRTTGTFISQALRGSSSFVFTQRKSGKIIRSTAPADALIANARRRSNDDVQDGDQYSNSLCIDRYSLSDLLPDSIIKEDDNF